MTEVRELYKCNVCGNVVEIVQEGQSALVCCGQDMDKLIAKTEDKGNEKHLPVVSTTEDGVLVKVGDVEHPMTDDHYIKFIEVMTTDSVHKKELSPDDKPEASFNISISEIRSVREYCTIHDLWENSL